MNSMFDNGFLKSAPNGNALVDAFSDFHGACPDPHTRLTENEVEEIKKHNRRQPRQRIKRRNK